MVRWVTSFEGAGFPVDSIEAGRLHLLQFPMIVSKVARGSTTAAVEVELQCLFVRKFSYRWSSQQETWSL